MNTKKLIKANKSTKRDAISKDQKYNQICKMTTSGSHMWEYREVYHCGMYHAKCKLCGVVDA